MSRFTVFTGISGLSDAESDNDIVFWASAYGTPCITICGDRFSMTKSQVIAMADFLINCGEKAVEDPI